MISGETVKVSLLELSGQDEYGNELEVFGEPFEVANVLCGRGSTSDPDREGEPYAIRSDKRFSFPRGFDADLRGAIIEWDGRKFKVVGEPVKSTEANLPPGIPWNIRCETVRHEG